MSTISTYTDLLTAMTEWLARDQDATIIARQPTFVQFFEANANRTLFVRQMEARSTTTVDITTTEPEMISLPTDFQSMRRIRVSSALGKPSLEYRSGVQIEEYRTSIANVASCPRYFTIFGSEIELCPTPDSNVTIEMVYRQNIPALASNSTNWLLTSAPDLYLYGSLLHSAPYIKEDARIQTWGLGYKTALDDLNNLGLTSTFNAGPMRVTASGPTP